MIMRTTILAVSLLAALALTACKKEEPAATTSEPAPAPAAPATTAPAPAPATPAPTPTEPVASSTGDIGVAECDDFLAKYEACLSDKVPEAARATLQQSLNATRDGWRQAAATPAGRDGLKTACEQARTAARPSLQTYGCTDF